MLARSFSRQPAGAPGGQFRPQSDPHAQFFPEFPVQRSLALFPGFHLPAGELPESGELLGGSPPGHQHPGGLGQRVKYCAANYLYPSSHRSSLWGTIDEAPRGRAPQSTPLSKSRHMSSVVQSPPATKTPSPRIAPAIVSLAMGGFGIGVTEFTMMGLLKEVEAGLGISTPEAGHLISAYALGVVVGAPLLAAVGAKLPRKHLALGLMLFFSVANLTSYLAPDYATMLVSRFAAGLPHGAFFGVAAVIAASLVSPTRRGWAISMVMAGLTVSNVVGVPAGHVGGPGIRLAPAVCPGGGHRPADPGAALEVCAVPAGPP